MFGAVLVNFVAMFTQGLAKGIPQEFVRFDYFEVPIDDRHETRHAFEKNVVFPLQRFVLGYVVGHFNDIYNIADFVENRRNVNYVVRRPAFAVVTNFVIGSNFAVFESASSHAVLAGLFLVFVDFIAILSLRVSKNLFEVFVGGQHLEVAIDHDNIVRYFFEQLPTNPIPDFNR